MERYAGYQTTCNNSVLSFIGQYGTILENGDSTASDKVNEMTSFALNCVTEWTTQYAQNLRVGTQEAGTLAYDFVGRLGLQPALQLTGIALLTLFRWTKSAVSRDPLILIRNQLTSLALDTIRGVVGSILGTGIVTGALWSTSMIFWGGVRVSVLTAYAGSLRCIKEGADWILDESRHFATLTHQTAEYNATRAHINRLMARAAEAIKIMTCLTVPSLALWIPKIWLPVEPDAYLNFFIPPIPFFGAGCATLAGITLIALCALQTAKIQQQLRQSRVLPENLMNESVNHVDRFVSIIDAGVANGNIAVGLLRAIKNEDKDVDIEENEELRKLRQTETEARERFRTQEGDESAALGLRAAILAVESKRQELQEASSISEGQHYLTWATSVLAASYFVESVGSDIFGVKAEVNGKVLAFVRTEVKKDEWTNLHKKQLEFEVVRGEWSADYEQNLPPAGQIKRVIGSIASIIRQKHRTSILEAIQQVTA